MFTQILKSFLCYLINDFRFSLKTDQLFLGHIFSTSKSKDKHPNPCVVLPKFQGTNIYFKVCHNPSSFISFNNEDCSVGKCMEMQIVALESN